MDMHPPMQNVFGPACEHGVCERETGTITTLTWVLAVFHPLPVEASRLPGRPGTSAQLDEDQFYDHSSLSASPWWTISDFVKMTRWVGWHFTGAR